MGIINNSAGRKGKHRGDGEGGLSLVVETLKKRAEGKRERHQVRTDFLFARPDHWSGVASLWDLFGAFTYYNYSRTIRDADAKAIYSDFRLIGQDFYKVFGDFERQHHKQLPQQSKLFDPDEIDD